MKDEEVDIIMNLFKQVDKRVGIFPGKTLEETCDLLRNPEDDEEDVIPEKPEIAVVEEPEAPTKPVYGTPEVAEEKKE